MDINMTLLVLAAAGSGSRGQPAYDTLYAALGALGALALGAVVFATTKIFEGFFSSLGEKLADPFLALLTGRGKIVGGPLRKYRREISRNYAGHALGFGGADAIDIRTVYVPLRYEEAGRREDVYARIRDEARSVVVGPAGAGKSLLLKHSMLTWADENRLHHWHQSDRRLPVLVQLHRLNEAEIANDAIEALVIRELADNGLRRAPQSVERALRDGRLRLLLDGLDEVSRDRQERVVTLIRDFARSHPGCQLVVTCRDAVYHGQLSPEFRHEVRIAEFDDASIRRLLGNWPGIERTDVDGLMGALRANPQLMHLARSPLLLTMLAYLYVHQFAKQRQPLPASRVTFYETALGHLLGRDEFLNRGALATYEARQKFPALQRIALTMQRSTGGGPAERKEITQVAAVAAVKAALPDLNLDEDNAWPLLDEIVHRSQLLVWLDQQRSRCSFRHLTMQEFLAARELADRPDELLAGYRNDPDGWREVVKLWCGVTTRNSAAVINEVLTFGELRHQVLALECLAEAQYLDNAFAASVIDHFFGWLGMAGSADQVLTAGFGALAASGGPRGDMVLRRLTELADPATGSQVDQVRRAAIAALSASGRQEAAQSLAALAARDQTARTALRAMGELAIPVLERQARDGDPAATDDLAFIGTPAAAESLTYLMFDADSVSSLDRIAVIAAWRLAELLIVPGVEEGLKAFRPQLPDSFEVYDWIWAPFAVPGEQYGPLPKIMGRAAFLIDKQPDFTPPTLGDVDLRIAIPLVGIGAGQRLRTGTAALRRNLAAAAGKTTAQTEAAFLGAALPDADPDISLIEAGTAMLAKLGLPAAQRTLAEKLSWPVRARLLAALFSDRITSAGQRDWREIRHNPHSAFRLWTSFYTLLGVSAVTTLGFASYWQYNVVFDGAQQGPAWPYWTTSILFYGALALMLVFFASAFTTDEDNTLLNASVLFLFIAAFGMICDACLDGWILARWYGTGAALLGSLLPIAAATLLGWLAARRSQRFGNPLRHMYLASGKSLADRTSVIAK
jgi:hypothetical protein